MATTRDTIVDSAITILDEWGLADLSMRRVAEAAGIQAASIYYHFANKQSLLAAVSDRLLVNQTDASDLKTWAAELRRTLLAHRDGAEIVSATLAVELGLHTPVEDAATILEKQGLAKGCEYSVAKVFVHFVLGHVFQEQSRARLIELGVLKFSSEALDDEGFDVGLEILIAGCCEMTIR